MDSLENQDGSVQSTCFDKQGVQLTAGKVVLKQGPPRLTVGDSARSVRVHKAASSLGGGEHV